MKSKIVLLLSVLLVLSALILAEAPPSFESQQFYGTVTWKLGDTPKQVIVKTATKVYTSAITFAPCLQSPCTGSYGYEKSNILLLQAGTGEKLDFFVDTIKVGEQIYTSGAVTKVDWDLTKIVKVEEKKQEEKPAEKPVEKNETNTTSSSTSSSSSSSSLSSSSSSSGGSVKKNDTLQTPALQPCTKSWVCGNGWGACVGGSQTRKCVDEKNCDSLYSEGKVSFVISGAKPKEVQSCVMPLVTVPVKEDVTLPVVQNEEEEVEEEEIVSATQKPKKASCMDGLKNQNEEEVDCGGVCKACESGLLAGNLMYYILGVVVIIGLGVGVYFYMKSRDGGFERGGESSDDVVNGQLEQVYNSGEAKGLSDSEITSRLVAKGWDEAVLSKFLKGR